MYQEYNYLIHSKGPWKDHKYIAKKTGSNGKPVYIYSEYKKGDKDFDFEGEEWNKNFKRVGDTDGFMKTNPDGTITIVEEDMKWTLPKGTKVNDDLVNKLLDGWKNDSRKYRTKEYQKEQEVNKKREQTARTATAADLSAAKRAKAVANAYKDQQDAAERRGKIIAEAYADQKKKEKKTMTHGANTEGYSYLIHSAKGSTWSKKNAKYLRKYKKNGRWYYIYGRDQKATSESVDEMRDADREKRRNVAKAKKAIRNTASDTVSNLHETLSNNKAEAQRKRRENFKEDFRETVDRATKVSNAKKAIRNAAAEKVEAKRTKSRQHLADMFEEAYNEASRKPKKNHFTTRR